MVFCRGCGKEIHESALACPHCGAPQHAVAMEKDIPDGVRGWSWGAFLLNWIWAIGNKTWIGLLALIPYVGFVMAIVLGIKGREWAWRNKEWASLEEFNRVQRKWSAWGVGLVIGFGGIGILAAIAIPAYQSYTQRAQEVQLQLEQKQEEASQADAQAQLEAQMRQRVEAQAQREAEMLSQQAQREAALAVQQTQLEAERANSQRSIATSMSCEDIAHDFTYYKGLESVCDYQAPSVSVAFKKLGDSQECQIKLGRRFEEISSQTMEVMRRDVQARGLGVVCREKAGEYSEMQSTVKASIM